MLIVGAGGCAKQVLSDLVLADFASQMKFYSDYPVKPEDWISQHFDVLHSMVTAGNYFMSHDPRFILATGDPSVRKRLCSAMTAAGGSAHTFISRTATISPLDTYIGNGCLILADALVETSATIGQGCLLNVRSMISHDSTLGDFCEIGPYAVVLGSCSVGSETLIGAGAVVLKNVKIGDRVKIGAGAVVTRDVPSDTTVVGVPARARS